MDQLILDEAVVLVGGKGTRLQSIVSDRPKPLAEVCGRPFIEWLLLGLRSQGIQHIVLCAGYMAERLQDDLGTGEQLGIEITYAIDPFPLGTGGALRNALGEVQSNRFLALNGDSYCRFDVTKLLKSHLVYSAQATLWLVECCDSARYGSVVLADNGAICGFHEKDESNRGRLINAGVYLLERSVVEDIPIGQAVSLEKEVFPGLIGCGLYGVEGRGPFIDIGTPESYRVANRVLQAEFEVLRYNLNMGVA